MAGQSTLKGNPAHVRASNAKRQARHQQGWANVQAAKNNGTHRTVKNRLANEVAQAARVATGFGARERRRLLTGKRLPKTDAEVAFIAAHTA